MADEDYDGRKIGVPAFEPGLHRRTLDRVKSAEASFIAIILGEADGLRASSFNILYITS